MWTGCTVAGCYYGWEVIGGAVAGGVVKCDGV